MIFVLAPDSFKESMTAPEACHAMAAGIKKIIPGATCIQVPLADGGEGTLQTLVAATGGKIYKHAVTGPLGDKVTGEYGILGDSQTGIVELASASGLHLVPTEKRNPGKTTTYGTGELIKVVLGNGIKKLIIGLGGSATNDGGAGIAQALGVKFLNSKSQEIQVVGENLMSIAQIDTSGMIFLPSDLKVEVACDVSNPLTGAMGAARTYGLQKGATEAMITELDQGLQHYGVKLNECLGKQVENVPGAGAAGGAGAGLMAFLDARLVKGIDLVLNHTKLEEKIKAADYIFTGEGSIDKQTAYGKTIAGVVALAQKFNKPVIAFAGKIADAEMLYQMGITAIFGIVPNACSIAEALKAGQKNLENTASAVTRLIHYTSGK